MERVAAVLERERELLENLLFKLVETRLILEHDEQRFLTRATREVERARTRTREIDLMRAATVAHYKPGATLRDLAATASEPWPGILRDHHELLASLVAEIEMTAHRNAEQARIGLEALQPAHARSRAPEPSESMEVPAMTDSAPGVGLLEAGVDRSTGIEAELSHNVDTARGDEELARLALGAALESVLGTAARLRMPGLIEFLR
jgi:hypothetical protein